jgi:seryl-tRNA synthetase
VTCIKYSCRTEQNDILKQEYKKVLTNINERVSQTLSKNEESVRQIKMLEQEKGSERKRLVKEFARLMRHWEEERNIVQEQVQSLQKAYEEKTQDLQDLMEFEVIAFKVACFL